MDHGCGYVTSPWAAVIGHHAMATAGSAADVGFAVAAAAVHVQNASVAASSQHNIHTHHALVHPHTHRYHPHTHPHPHHMHPHSLNTNGMDLHVPQGFPYYRYREDPLCWEDRKSMEEISAAQSSVNARILELRKEKSRDAARSRRGKENYEFYELAKMLPLPAAITSQLDKASIIRLTISYLKLRDFSGHGDPPWARETSCASKLKSVTIRRSPAVDLFEQHQGTHILQSLDGFALAVAADGRFLYISETVSIYLGLSQVEMTGSSIFDYIHHSDHAEIAEQLGLSLTSTGVSSGNCSSTGNGVGAGHASPISGASDDDNISHGTNNPDVSAQMTVSSTAGYKGYERSFCVRMKSTLTKRGCHFKSSGYRVVLLLCKLRPQYTFSHTRKTEPPLLGMVALAIALPPPSVHEIRLECDMFVTRISFDFKIAHVEPRVSDLLDYSPEDLINRSMYALCHAEDADRLRKSHSDLIEKGQVLTGYFRFMNKRSGYIYMQCCATVVCSTKNSDEQNIICVNYVISNCESQNLVLDTCQLEVDVDVIKREEQNNEKSSGPDSPANNDPIADSQANQEQNSLRTKTETDSQTHSNCITSGRSTNTPSSQSSGSANRVKETRTPPSSLEEPDPCTASTTNGLGNIKRKRKGKTAFVPIQHHAVLNDTQSLAKMITISNCLINETATTDTAQNKKPEGGEPEQEQNVESSVRDLEHAMSKHLPTHAEVANGANVSTDFSTNSLLKQQHQQQQQQEQGEKSSSSTIQWIGSAPTYRQPSPMPATALLRQLYANRESVIRATARQTPTGVFYGESSQNATLPTPPSSESSYEQQYLHLHSQKPNTSTDAFTNLVSTYGGYHSTLDYHNTMTPPSSVSPREPNSALNNSVATTAKVHEHTPNADGIDAVVVGGYEYGADPLRPQYANHGGSENVAPTLLLKPQPYSAAAIHHSHATTDVVYNNLDQHPVSQSQYFTHSSFHLYHKGASAGGWYSTPT